jgi:hypothetical protein
MAEEVKSPWELESGLPNDVDGWIAKTTFGKNENYMKALTVTDDDTQGTQIMFTLVDENGEEIGVVSYSVGTGWAAAEDGSSMANSKRKNVVRGSRFGDFQERVLKGLKAPVTERGGPTEAKTWNGLGFHWNQEKKTSVGGKVNDVLMPTVYLGIKDNVAIAVPSAAGEKIDELLEAKLNNLAQTMSIKPFQLAVMKIAEAAANDKLMSNVLEDGPTGYWAMHQKK